MWNGPMHNVLKPWILFVLLSWVIIAPADSAEPLVLKPSENGILRAELAVDSYSYTPADLIVTVDHPVELTLKSVTVIVPHNFVIKAPELGVEINQNVPAGKTVTVRFTPTHPGKAKFYCDKKLLFFKSHEEKGMKGTLEVKEKEVKEK